MHEVCPNRKNSLLIEGMIVECPERILHITIVTDVKMGELLVIRLVVLVEVIGDIEVILSGDIPSATQSSREVTVSLRIIGNTCKGSKEIAGMCRKF